MDRDFLTLQADDTLETAAHFLMKYHANNFPITNIDGEMIGTITYPLIVEALLAGVAPKVKVTEIMRQDFFAFNEDDTIDRQLLSFNEMIPVINKKRNVVGTLNPKKVVQSLLELEQDVQALEQMIELYEFCFDTAYEGVAVVDSNGYIKLFNESYARFTGVSKSEAIGKHCTEVIEGTRLPVVLETGIPERNQPHILQGQPMIVHRLPIWKGNMIIGAVGMLIFEGVSELYDTFNRAQQFFNKGGLRLSPDEQMPQRQQLVTFDQIIGESIALGEAKKRARKAAKTTATILLTGESGVGKELFARSIHSVSPYKDGPFIAINCAAIPRDLLESELFGYEDGAFTGAKKGGKLGKFELAHRGTLFLDEIAEMPMDLQTKLLRVLQEQRFERVGGSREIKVNIRLIVATNKSLEEQIEKGEFREDLYYRINVIPVEIPPLRKRKNDIPLLVSKLLEKTYKKHHLPAVELSKEAMQKLLEYDWPGNVRELANVIERIVVLAENKRIELDDLPLHLRGGGGGVIVNEEKVEQLDELSEENEKMLYIKVMREVAGNKSKAARKLGIHRSTLYKKLKKYGLDD